MSARPRPRVDERGFTLLELLVATVAGMFVVMAAFMLSRGATRLLTSESRIGAAQLNLRLGIERLRADLERASFMMTPNGLVDPDVCPDSGFPYFQGITYLPGGLNSVFGASATTAAMSVSANGVNPDAIVLMGNFTTTDTYAVADIDPNSYVITLQATSSSVRRLVNVGATGTPSAAVAAAFPTGHVLRLTNLKGSSQFLKIVSAQVNAAGQPTITVAPTPALVNSTQGTNKRCGYDGNGNQSTVNPVSIVQYQIRSLATNANWAWAYPNDIPADAFKYDLVRSVLATDGSPLPDTEQIVAEYAVDLAFSFSYDPSLPLATGQWVEPQLNSLAFGDQLNTTVAANVRGNATATPQRIRSVHYRLSTRSREPDRAVGLEPAQGPYMSRYQMNLSGGIVSFARVRTATGEVFLDNQQGTRW